jgi:hypothetical protein
MPRSIHFVGSIPLENAEAVFRTAAREAGPFLKRIPDGETGARHIWIGWQAQIFAKNPAFREVAPIGDFKKYGKQPHYELREGVAANQIDFGNLGYADAALASWGVFSRLQTEGVIPADVRFQVSLPTPNAVVQAFVVPDQIEAVKPVYERALAGELARILAGIPHERLALQWDVAVEIAMLEGMWGLCSAEKRQSIIDALAALASLVPDDVELGYHLCYGDAGHKHFKEPPDTGELVRISNELTAKARRRIDWIHMPVPRDRKDDAYFAPLRGLRLHEGTELYLGLIHVTGGAAGTRERIAAAERTLTDFGIATECGMGRRPPESIPALMALHGEAAKTA